MVGLAKKAGKVISGEAACVESIRFGKAYLVILADDCGPNTKKKIKDKCSFYDVKCIEFGDMDSLGRSIGNNFNAVVAITDMALSERINQIACSNNFGGDANV